MLDHQHGHLLNPHQKGVEVISAVEQGIVLQSDFPALVQKRLEILIGFVLVVLASQNGLNELGVPRSRLGFARWRGCGFEVLDILETAQSAGNVAGGKRIAVERGHHAHHVHHMAALRSARLNPRHIQRRVAQAEGGVDEPVSLHAAAKFLRYRDSIDLGLGNNQECHGMNGRERSRREDRPLDALLAFQLLSARPFHKRAQIGEVAKGLGVDRRLGADGQGLSNLCDHDADLPCRHLHPGVFGDGINQDRLEAEPRHQQVCLVPGFSMKGNRVVFRKRGPKPLAHQAHLRRPDRVDRLLHKNEDNDDQ